MPNYKKGKIYQIRSNKTDKVYVGSTIQSLSVRLAEHRRNYNLYCKMNKNKGCSSIELLCYDDYYIELIENYPCNSIEELNKREGEYIRKLNCVNKKIAGRTSHDYYMEHQDSMKTWHKNDYNKNKELYLERHKKRYEENKEKIKEQMKIYRENNKEKIKERMSKKIMCVCGCEIRYDNKSKHLKSDKHKKLMENII